MCKTNLIHEGVEAIENSALVALRGVHEQAVRAFTHSPTHSLTHSRSLSLSISLSLTHTHTRSLSLSLSLSHTHTHTHTLARSLTPPVHARLGESAHNGDEDRPRCTCT